MHKDQVYKKFCRYKNCDIPRSILWKFHIMYMVVLDTDQKVEEFYKNNFAFYFIKLLAMFEMYLDYRHGVH